MPLFLFLLSMSHVLILTVNRLIKTQQINTATFVPICDFVSKAIVRNACDALLPDRM